MKIALVFGVTAFSKDEMSSNVGPLHVPAEALERVVELVDRAAIELARGDELVARRQQRMEDEHLRRMAGGDGEAGGAAFERRDALLEHRVRRIADARVDVAERLQAEERRGVLDVVEHVGGGLIDRGGARAGRRDRASRRREWKAWRNLGRGRRSSMFSLVVFGEGDGFGAIGTRSAAGKPKQSLPIFARALERRCGEPARPGHFFGPMVKC